MTFEVLSRISSSIELQLKIDLSLLKPFPSFRLHYLLPIFNNVIVQDASDKLQAVMDQILDYCISVTDIMAFQPSMLKAHDNSNPLLTTVPPRLTYFPPARHMSKQIAYIQYHRSPFKNPYHRSSVNVQLCPSHPSFHWNLFFKSFPIVSISIFTTAY